MEILSFEIGNDILTGFEIENGFSSQLANLIQVLKNNLEKSKMTTLKLNLLHRARVPGPKFFETSKKSGKYRSQKDRALNSLK